MEHEDAEREPQPALSNGRAPTDARQLTTQVIISITGNALPFDLRPKYRELFQSGAA